MKMQHGFMHGFMSKGLLVSCLSLACLCACSDPEPVEPPPAPKPAAAAPAQPPAPVIVNAEPESDAVALSEESLDKVKAEQDELAGRAADLEEQVKDSEMLLAMKEKQIKELEAQLKKNAARK